MCLGEVWGQWLCEGLGMNFSKYRSPSSLLKIIVIIIHYIYPKEDLNKYINK